MNRKFLLIIVLFSIALFSSCSGLFNKKNVAIETKYFRPTNKYGAYLSGRVAHLRRDFNLASNYYIAALSVEENKELVDKVYIMLASERRIPEAAKFAKEAIENGDKNNFSQIIVFVDDFNNKKYQASIDRLEKIKGTIYEEFINPLLISWSYVGLGDKEKALETIEPFSKIESFGSLYEFHAGMIYDYFGDVDEAKRNYDIIVNKKSSDMSFRTLQIISNFYLRIGEQEEAVKMVSRYYDDKYISDMLKRLLRNTKNANGRNVEKIVNSPNIGLSESLFSIAASLRDVENGMDVSHVFISLSIYTNKDYDLAKLMLGDILQIRELNDDAIKIYYEIPKISESYYIAQQKIAYSYVMKEDYENSIKILEPVVRDNPKEYQFLLELADSYRMFGEYKKSIKFYEQAIASLEEEEEKHWVAYYALGIAYDSINHDNWEKSEKAFQKALDLQPDNLLVLNYLGYSWLERGKNTEDAFSMIVNSYNQMSNSGHITDSLGWSFYTLGIYDYAVKYLETASEIEPANALISDHLGDAYWQNGRRIEAIYQWERALVLEKDKDRVDLEKVKLKISNGLEEPVKIKYNKNSIDATISLIEN